MFNFLLPFVLAASIHFGSSGINDLNCDEWERTDKATWLAQAPVHFQMTDGTFLTLKPPVKVAADDSYGLWFMLEIYCREEPSITCEAGPCPKT